MTKKLDLNKTVYELVNEYPEVAQIMAGLGFSEITKPAMLHSVGKIMTIPKGSKMKGIPLEKIITAFAQNGFDVTGVDNTAGKSDDHKAVEKDTAPKAEKETAQSANPATAIKKTDLSSGTAVQENAGAAENAAPAAADARTEKLKSYLKRLGAGEDLEDVRADFVREFGDVDAAEIMKAEQSLLADGEPLDEVQKLCDVHSALFHGATREEKIMNAERAVNASLMKEAAAGSGKMEGAQAASEQTATAAAAGKDKMADAQAAMAKAAGYPGKNYSDKNSRAEELENIPGHPLRTFTRENDALSALLALYKATGDESLISKIQGLAVHYAKKGDLLYPLLKVRYGISGPSEVMWTVDDEIRAELSSLAKADTHDESWRERFAAVLQRAEEMIYKEQNILFPICAVNFTEEEWMGIYRDSKDYDSCFGVTTEIWDAAENAKSSSLPERKDEVVMPGGHMTVPQLTALLNTIPMEITFVDDANINRFFNEGPKVFKRPAMALDREVFTCHPPKVEPMVRKVIESFRSGERDEFPIWMEKNGRTMLVRYMAVRDTDGKYVGTAELVQDMEFAKTHFAEK